MITQKECFPKLLKRKHIINDIGLSDTLYYKLIKENKLPTVRINNRVYIDRDKLFDLLESGLLDISNTSQLSNNPSTVV